MIFDLRWLNFEVKSWRTGGLPLQKSKFNNHHSSMNPSSPSGA
jgi:hypothetical protein